MPDSTRKKRIGFYTAGPAFDGGTLARKALGGSETALIQASRALAGRGREVVVFNHCESPGIHDGVTWMPADRFPRYVARGGFDVFIVSRYYDFFQIPFPAGLKVLWNHDTLDNPAGLRRVESRIDVFLLLSGFHRDNYLTRLPHIAPRCVVTRNGLDFDLIDRALAKATKDPNRVLYASRPERGLALLLEHIWPRLIECRPDLRLELCGYHVDPADLAPGLAEEYERIDRLVASIPNVAVLGALAKEDYYRRLAGAGLMLYPCTFPEISCIAALEAQALETPILTTDGFALSETVAAGELRVPGRPGSREYMDEYVRRALHLLDNPDLASRLARDSADFVRGRYAWEIIAAQWERVFDLFSRDRQSQAEGGGI